MEPKYASPVASPRASASFASPSVVGNFLDFMLPKAQSTAIKAVAQKSSSSPLRTAATYTVITNQSLSARSSDPSAQRLSSPAVSSGGIDESMQLLNLEDLSACLLEYSTSSGAVGDQQTQQKLPKSTPSGVVDGGVGGGDRKGISLEEQEAVEHAVRFNAEELRHLEEAFEDFSQQDTTAAAAAGCRPPSSRNVQSADTCGILRSPPSMTTSVLESPDATMASSIPSLTESSSSKPSVADVETRCSVLSERNANATNSPASPRSYKPTFPTAATLLSQEEEKEEEEEEDIENQRPNTNSSKPVALLDAQDDSFSRSLSDPIYRRRLSTILECQSKESLMAVKSSASNPPDASEIVQRSAVFNTDFPDLNTTSSSLPTEASAPPTDQPFQNLPRTPRLPRGVLSAARFAYRPVSTPSAEDLQINLSVPDALVVSPSAAAVPITTQVTVSCRRPLGEITLDGLRVRVNLDVAEPAPSDLPIRLPSVLQPDSLSLLPSRLSTPLTFNAQPALASDAVVSSEGFVCDLLLTAHVFSTSAGPVRSLSSTTKRLQLRCERPKDQGETEDAVAVGAVSAVSTADEIPAAAAPSKENDSTTTDAESSAATPHYSDFSPPGAPEVVADGPSAARTEEPSTEETSTHALDKSTKSLPKPLPPPPPPSEGKSDTTASLFATTKCLFWPAASYDSSRSQFLILKHKFPGVVRIRLEVTSGADVFMLLNDRGLPSKGGRIIELPAELQCTIGVVYSPLPGQQWHFGELQLRVDSPSRVHSKVRLIGYAESSKIDIYCCKRVDENTFWSVAFPCHPPRMDLPSPQGQDRRLSAGSSVIATEPAWVTRVVVSNWGQRTAWVLVRYSPWTEKTASNAGAATTDLQASRLTVKPDRFFLAPNQTVDVHITISGEPIVARVLFYHGDEVIRQQFRQSYRGNAGRKQHSDASRVDTSVSRLHTFDLIDIPTAEDEKENSFLTAEVSTAPIASVRPELWRQWLHTELKETPPLTLMVRCVEQPSTSSNESLSQPSPQPRPTSSLSAGHTTPVSTSSVNLRHSLQSSDRGRASTDVGSVAVHNLSRSASPPATTAILNPVLPLQPLGQPHVPVSLRIIGSPATFTKSDSSAKVSLLNLSHQNPLIVRLGQLVSPFFLIKPSARKFKLKARHSVDVIIKFRPLCKGYFSRSLLVEWAECTAPSSTHLPTPFSVAYICVSGRT